MKCHFDVPKTKMLLALCMCLLFVGIGYFFSETASRQKEYILGILTVLVCCGLSLKIVFNLITWRSAELTIDENGIRLIDRKNWNFKWGDIEFIRFVHMRRAGIALMLIKLDGVALKTVNERQKYRWFHAADKLLGMGDFEITLDSFNLTEESAKAEIRKYYKGPLKSDINN